MPRRQILNARQRATLFDLPTDQETLLRHYTLADDDIENIQSRRRAHNRFGVALQLCAFRYPGRLLMPGEIIPSEITEFLAAQLGLKPDDLADYAHRAETRREHLADLRNIYGYKMFTGRGARDLMDWLAGEAETAQSNVDLAQRFVERCRRSMMIVPGVTTVERLSADALVSAERRIETRIVDRLDEDTKRKLDGLLSEMVDDRITRFVWLRQFEVGGNSADVVGSQPNMRWNTDRGNVETPSGIGQIGLMRRTAAALPECLSLYRAKPGGYVYVFKNNLIRRRNRKFQKPEE